MTGKVGLKGVTKFFTEILKLRWTIEPGDVLFVIAHLINLNNNSRLVIGLLQDIQYGLLTTIIKYFFGTDHHMPMTLYGKTTRL